MHPISYFLRVVIIVSAVLAILAVGSLAPARSQASAPRVMTTEIKGAIGVAATTHICGVLEEAATSGATLVVLTLDTPGGLLSATRDMIQCILASIVPVAVYVSPSGARAASAGTYIALAAHVAAMAPSTHIGAATPVALSPSAPRRPADPQPGTPQNQPQQGAEQKAVNDAVAYLKGLAELRGRNSAWAEKAVREAATMTASEALRERVIDIVASDQDDLLHKLEGRTVTAGGKSVTITISGAQVLTVEPGWRLRLLQVLSDPNIAFILLLIGIYGILFEFWSPGALVPGIVGGIILLLALTALSLLPLRYGALALLLLGIGLMIAEAFVAGFGLLGLGGFSAFVIGAVFLFDPSAADFDLRLVWPVVIGAAATAALLSKVVLVSALQARRRRPVAGSEQIIGLIGEVVAWKERSGFVHVHGETWGARGDQNLMAGDRVQVVDREGLTLTVAPVSEERRTLP